MASCSAVSSVAPSAKASALGTKPGDKVLLRGVYISTYGCQMNVNDTERMLSLLEMSNYTQVDSPDKAMLIVINTCSVREKPVHKLRSEVGRYARLKKHDPNILIGVGGCVAQQKKQELLQEVPLVDFVFGTDAIDQLPSIVQNLEAKRRTQAKAKLVVAQFEHKKPYQVETLVRCPGVSSFVNITKGCDNFCTFCIVPFTRGRERSRALKELVWDVERLCRRGVKEIVLLGQNVNSYRSACGAGFAELLVSLCEKTQLSRLRYTTSHPKDFNEELIDVLAQFRDKIVEHVHLPVQSGNSDVLKAMNRGYTRAEYIKKAHKILKKIPGVALSTDIIVGFPGETGEQFEDTLSLLEQVPYESLFAFKYSPRPKTKAARFTDQVPEPEKSARLQRLFAKHRALAQPLLARHLGTRQRVLVEEQRSDGTWYGRSPHNRPTYFKGACSGVGSFVEVHIEKIHHQSLWGRCI